MVDFGAFSTKLGKGLQKVFGSQNERTLASFKSLVKEVNGLEDWAKGMDQAQIQARVVEWREKVQSDRASLDEAMPEIFAMTREASVRTLGLRHFDVQLVGGANLHRGNISEMVTGEGKTLIATLAAALNALEGKGVYIVTVNDYLAQRDRDWMAPIFEYLGLTVGAIQSNQAPSQRHAHYACDILYGTNNEFGFDYLRDNMKWEPEEQVQKTLNFAIIDEVDSILVDEARTPLIISGSPEQGKSDKYLKCDRIARQLNEGDHFEIKLKEQQCLLSEDGIEKAEKLVGVDSFYSDVSLMDWPHHIEQALKAHYIYKRDKEYVVATNNETGDVEVIIVDEFTGRLMSGRRWSDGLHQAVEAKEGLPPKEETQTLATITLQNYFRMFDKLAGMTGTAMTEAAEFSKIYGLDVLAIPTNRPMARDDYQDQIYLDSKDKYAAIVEEVRENHARGRPMLIGTTSIEKSEEVDAQLTEAEIPHEVLNAKNHEREARIIAQAGRKGAITVATNMAGRGTDIVLGGNLEGLFAVEIAERGIDAVSDEAKELRATLEVQCKAEQEHVLIEGGLCVIGTERHEARRIDNQLRGRCGRQGDPGATKFFLSFDDDLMRIFARDWVKPLMEKLGLKHGERIESGMVSRRIAGAQKKVEQRNFEIRKNLIEYDEVMDKQRKFVYTQRQQMLEFQGFRDKILGMFEEVLVPILDVHGGDQDKPVDYDEIHTWMRHKFGNEVVLDGLEKVDRDELDPWLVQRVEDLYDNRAEHYGADQWEKIQQFILVDTVDNKWKDHLFAMEVLKHGIGLRGYAQLNPKDEFKKEGFQKFEMLKAAIADQVTDLVFKVELQEAPDARQMHHQGPIGLGDLPDDPATQAAMIQALIDSGQAPPELMEAVARGEQVEIRNSPNAPQQAEPAPETASPVVAGGKKPKRNEPCPCGSGIKYKKCCHPAFD
jgi:preprotein translocase subunit SecA